MMGVDENGRRRAMAADHFHDPAIAHLRESLASPFLGGRHAQHAKLRQAIDHGTRNIGVAVDGRGVDMSIGEFTHGRDGRVDSIALVDGKLGIREERTCHGIRPERGPWRIPPGSAP